MRHKWNDIPPLKQEQNTVENEYLENRKCSWQLNLKTKMRSTNEDEEDKLEKKTSRKRAKINFWLGNSKEVQLENLQFGRTKSE